LLLTYCVLPIVDLRCLDDSLAVGTERNWNFPLLRSSKHRLDDPCSLTSDIPVPMPEIAVVGREIEVISLIGSIDQRKRVPLLLESWKLVQESVGAVLVIAGKQSVELRRFLASAEAPFPKVYIVDRYLSDQEMAWLVERSKALVVLSDMDHSSGTLLSALGRGRWVISLEGRRVAAVANRHAAAITCAPTPESLADAIQRLGKRDDLPKPVKIPSAHDFGLSLLQMRPSYFSQFLARKRNLD
jgi:glycosyltransferase involved in cell wall biosynthesis